MKNQTRERRLQSFEALQIALATEDAKYMSNTREIDRQVEALYLAGRRGLAQLRYAENALWPVTFVTSELRPSIQVMPRHEVITALRDVHVRHPEMQAPLHRDCETLSDHDLRTMLEDAFRLVEDEE